MSCRSDSLVPHFTLSFYHATQAKQWNQEIAGLISRIHGDQHMQRWSRVNIPAQNLSFLPSASSILGPATQQIPDEHELIYSTSNQPVTLTGLNQPEQTLTRDHAQSERPIEDKRDTRMDDEREERDSKDFVDRLWDEYELANASPESLVPRTKDPQVAEGLHNHRAPQQQSVLYDVPRGSSSGETIALQARARA